MPERPELNLDYLVGRTITEISWYPIAGEESTVADIRIDFEGGASVDLWAGMGHITPVISEGKNDRGE